MIPKTPEQLAEEKYPYSGDEFFYDIDRDAQSQRDGFLSGHASRDPEVAKLTVDLAAANANVNALEGWWEQSQERSDYKEALKKYIDIPIIEKQLTAQGLVINMWETHPARSVLDKWSKG